MKKIFKVFLCMLFVLSFTKVLATETEQEAVKTPTLRETLTEYKDGVFYYSFDVDPSDYEITEEKNSQFEVFGFQLYEVQGKDDDLSYAPIKDAVEISETVKVNVPVGESRTYAAKVMGITLEDESVIQSDYSKLVVLDHIKPKKPVLTNDNDSYVKFENNKFTYNLSLNNEDYYLNPKDENPLYVVDGYEFYEVVDGENKLVKNGTLGDTFTVELEKNESKTYVVRVFTKDSEGNNVYSDFSDKLVVKNEMLLIDDVKDAFVKTKLMSEILKGVRKSEPDATITLDQTDKTKNVLNLVDNEGEVALSFTFNDEYISFAGVKPETVDDVDLGNAIVEGIFINNLIYTVLDLNGYTDKDLDFGEKEDLDIEFFNKYGILLDSDKVEFKDEDSSTTITYIKEFRISLDKLKIKML